jgi:uncharacterized protein
MENILPNESDAVSADYLQLALCAALVEGMYPNFALFCDAAKQAGDSVYRNALNLVWEYASGRTEAISFSRQQEKLEPCIPDPDDFDMYGVRPALDACVGLTLLLQACELPQQDDFQSLATLSRGTVEQYLEATGYEGEVESHPLIERLQALVEELSQVDLDASDRRGSVDRVRAIDSEDGLSNIGISID